MISVFARTKELRLKRAILKGVYKDNLIITGKLKNVLLRKRPFYQNKIFLSFVFSILVLLLYGNYFADPPFSDEQVISDILTHEYFPQTANAQGNYTSLILNPETSAIQLLDALAGPFSNMSFVNNSEIPTIQFAENSAEFSNYKSFANNPEIPLSNMFGLEVKTILIDPGHGGNDPGASGKLGTKEKIIALDIAKRLKKRLEKFGNFNVLMTREKDISLSLNERVEIANALRADLFISIHLNSLPSLQKNFIETYYFGPSNDKKVLKLAEKENKGSEYRLSDFKNILKKIGETFKLQESRKLAVSIQNKLFLNTKKQNGNVFDFGVKRAPFLVLLGVDVPAVLVEVSSLSNSEEETRLNTESHRENIAHFLEAGILNYLNKGEITYEAKR